MKRNQAGNIVMMFWCFEVIFSKVFDQ